MQNKFLVSISEKLYLIEFLSRGFSEQEGSSFFDIKKSLLYPKLNKDIFTLTLTWVSCYLFWTSSRCMKF